MGDHAPPWGELFALSVDRVSETVEEMHLAIVDPWFRFAGPVQRQLRGVSAGATSAVYRSVRGVAGLVGALVDTIPDGPPAGERSVRSGGVQAFANAVWGDEFDRRASSMAIGVDVRDASGEIVPPDAGSLARAFPEASGRVVVLLHGLGQTERCFTRSDGGMADALASSSFTPVLVRYNSGRAVAENGGELSTLVEQLCAGWPVPVAEIDLVGYSMGGLVARTAIDIGRSSSERWTQSVRHVVTIATPHAGSPIEKGVEALSRALMVAPQSRPLGRFIAKRSAGIRDLRTGVALPSAVDGVKYHLIAAVVTSNTSHPVGSLVGDLVVRPGSATDGKGTMAGDRVLIGRRRHDDILDDPSVSSRILAWLDAD